MFDFLRYFCLFALICAAMLDIIGYATQFEHFVISGIFGFTCAMFIHLATRKYGYGYKKEDSV